MALGLCVCPPALPAPAASSSRGRDHDAPPPRAGGPGPGDKASEEKGEISERRRPAHPQGARVAVGGAAAAAVAAEEEAGSTRAAVEAASLRRGTCRKVAGAFTCQLLGATLPSRTMGIREEKRRRRKEKENIIP